MTRHWIIAPVEAEPRDLFDKEWQFDLSHDIISVGWAQLGDTSKMSQEQLKQAVASAYPDRSLASKRYITKTMWTFYHDIAPGDFVIARRGLKVLEAVGQVKNQSAFYEPRKNPFLDHHNFLEVSWRDQPRGKIFPAPVFIQNTVQEVITEGSFTKLLEGSEIVLSPVEAETFISPEKYLEDFIVSNFGKIFNRELVIYKDDDGRDGQQYPTETGPIDILAVEQKSKSFVVIELKKGQSSDKAIGQTLRYMGWVKEELCNEGQAVKGLIICRDSDRGLFYALKMLKDTLLMFATMNIRSS